VMEGESPSSSTSLEVTRGYNDTDRFGDVREAVLEWEVIN